MGESNRELVRGEKEQDKEQMCLCAFVLLQGGTERGADSCRLSMVVCTKEYILHVTRKGNRYGSMSLPSVTGASHVRTDKRRAGPRQQQQGPSPAIVLQAGG